MNKYLVKVAARKIKTKIPTPTSLWIRVDQPVLSVTVWIYGLLAAFTIFRGSYLAITTHDQIQPDVMFDLNVFCLGVSALLILAFGWLELDAKDTDWAQVIGANLTFLGVGASSYLWWDNHFWSAFLLLGLFAGGVIFTFLRTVIPILYEKSVQSLHSASDWVAEIGQEAADLEEQELRKQAQGGDISISEDSLEGGVTLHGPDLETEDECYLDAGDDANSEVRPQVNVPAPEIEYSKW